MKALRILACTLIAIVLTSTITFAQGWRQVVSPTYPSGTTFYDVYFVNSTTGWVVGSDGYILKAVDGGITWTEQISNTTNTLYAIYFIDENTGFAAGNNRTLVKTTNGGATWVVSEITDIPDASGSIKSIYFSDANNGWIMSTLSSTNGRILRTTNGGTSWTLDLTVAAKNLNDMHFSAPNKGVAVGKDAGTLYYTTNGTTWTLAPTPSLGGFSYTRSDIRGVYMANQTTAVAVGWGSMVGLQPSIHLNTTDGGANWTYMTQTEANRSYDNLYGVWFKDASNGFCVGGALRGSVVEKTTDGGSNWTILNAPFGVTLYGVHGNDNKVWICGSDGVIAYSNDNGATWNLSTPIPAASLYGIHFTSPSIGFIGGFDGIFLKTTNAGENWKASFAVANKRAPNINDIHFVNDNTGYLAQSYRMVSKTTDGGATWNMVLPDSLLSTAHSYGLFFQNENLGWVVGQYTSSIGVVHKTTNGGATWTSMVGAATKALRAVAFANANIGAAVGAAITALYTTDGGATWTPATVSGVTTGDIRDVIYINESLAFACGAKMILKSTNGGTSWTNIVPTVNATLYSIAFKDANNGFAAGSNELWQTTDGGDTWTNVIDPIMTSTLWSVAYDKTGNPWVGAAGSVLYNYSTPPSVTFRVNMKVKIKEGFFRPAIDTLVIRGSFNDWSGFADRLTDPDVDSFYTFTKTLASTDPIEFKFVVRKGGTDFWENIDNRKYSPPPGASTYDGGYFDNDSLVSIQVQTYFAVNMELERLSGRFKPATDTVSVNGSFQGWTPKANRLLPNPLNPDVYEGTFPILAAAGETIEFKFWYTPNNWESIDNRKYTFTAANIASGAASYTGNFNDGTLATVLNQPATLKFTVFVPTGAKSSINNLPFPVVNTVHIAGSALPLQWPGGGWPDADITKVIRLYDDGTHGDATAGDKVFTNSIIYPAYTVLTVKYKYGVNWGDAANNGGGNDNEAGFAQDHTLKMHRFLGSATVVDTFNVRPDSSWLKNIVLVGVEDQIEIPKVYSLSQNYPNPFNPTTTIRFGLPKESKVTLWIYNILGEEVLTLINGEVMNAGEYNYEFNASRLASGTYIYRLTAGEFTQTKKMILLK